MFKVFFVSLFTFIFVSLNSYAETASFYSHRLEGRKMANGEKYRGYRMIAASNKFPLGSIVEVLNISNGKRVRVKITDRGYFSHRHIDLSIRAFKVLDKTKKGKIKVRVRRIR